MQINMADDAALFEAQMEHGEDTDVADEDEWRRSYYPSNVPEQYVVNAVSGAPYPFRVGSIESLRVFHVTDATGMCDNRGVRGTLNREPNHLYYTDPQEYMRHRGNRQAFDRAFVDGWRSRVDWLFPSSDSDPDKRAIETIRQEYRAKVARQYEEAKARNAAEHAAIVAAEEWTVTRRAREEEQAEAFAQNKSRAKAARKEEHIAAKKARNKHKGFLYRERRRRAAIALAKAAARGAKKSERRQCAYARMRNRNEQTALLQRTQSCVGDY